MNIQTDRIISDSLNYMRFPLAIIVVLCHIVTNGPLEIQGNIIGFDNMPLLKFFNVFVDATLRGISVPIFFVISGYMFFREGVFNEKIYAKKIKNRIKTLLIPYIVWNAIAVGLRLFYTLPIFETLMPTLHNINLDFSISAILNTFWDANKDIFSELPTDHSFPENAPLWFLRELMILVLLTPCFYCVIKKMKSFILVSSIVYISIIFIDLGYIGSLLYCSYFFCLGAYFSLNKKNIINTFEELRMITYIGYPLTIILYLICFYCDMTFLLEFVKSISVLFALLFSYNISYEAVNKGKKMSKFIASSSFFIYISHILICMSISKLLFVFFAPTLSITIIMIYLLSVILTIILLLSVYYVLNKYMPRMLTFLTGRRSILN